MGGVDPSYEPRRGWLTEREFLALPESHERLEFIDGEIILSPSPSPMHQRLVQRLSMILADWEKTHPPAMVGLSPLDVRMQPGRIVQPDLFVCKAGFPLDRTPVDVVPDLTVEVLSLQAAYDRLAKRVLYAQAGVPEYWIVDPYGQTVEQVMGMDTVTVERAVIVSRALDALELNVGALFEGLPRGH